MTGVGDRAAKWMRYSARALTMIWASFSTIFIVRFLLFDLLRAAMKTGKWNLALPELAKVVLFFGVSAAIPWLWEAVGGIVWVVGGLLVFIVYPMTMYGRLPSSVIIEASLWLGFLPLVTGFLFLASWWRSRR